MEMGDHQQIHGKRPSTGGSPEFSKFYSDDEEEEWADKEAAGLIGLLENGKLEDEIIEQGMMMHQLGHAKLQRQQQRRTVLMEQNPPNCSMAANLSASQHQLQQPVLSMESLHAEWVQRQISRAKLNKEEKERMEEAGAEKAKNFEKFRQIWRQNDELEITLPSSSSTSSCASSTLVTPSNNCTEAFQQEIERLRFEVHQLRFQNGLLMTENGWLCRNQAMLMHMLNLKQCEASALTAALVNLNPMKGQTPIPVPVVHCQQLQIVQHQHPRPPPPPPPPPPHSLPYAPAVTIINGEHFFQIPPKPTGQQQLQFGQRPAKPSNYWNASDCGPEVVVSFDGLTVSKRGVCYVNDFGSVRAKFPIRLTVGGFFYFELKMVVRNNRIWTGLSTHQFPLHNSLGHRHGWGYANFGCFYECGRAKAYGEEFDAADVIGCGLDLTSGELFFTKNGKYLGIATKIPLVPATQPLFPTVSMCAEGSVVEANFGQAKFSYDTAKLGKE